MTETETVEATCGSCGVVKMIEKGSEPDCPSSLCDGALTPKDDE